MLVESLLHACVVDQNVQPRLKLRKGICCLFYVMQALKIQIEKAEIQIILALRLYGGCCYVGTLRRPSGNVDSTHPKTNLEFLSYNKSQRCLGIISCLYDLETTYERNQPPVTIEM